MDYRGCVTGDWAIAVARGVHRRSATPPGPTIDEVWVGADLALYVRYRLGRRKVGARLRLDTDPTSGTAPRGAERLASVLFHFLSGPAACQFIDPDGYRWWGDDPRGDDWSTALHRVRIMTIS